MNSNYIHKHTNPFNLDKNKKSLLITIKNDKIVTSTYCSSFLILFDFCPPPSKFCLVFKKILKNVSNSKLKRHRQK